METQIAIESMGTIIVSFYVEARLDR